MTDHRDHADDRTDRLLHAAGHAWRSRQAAPPEPDPSRWTELPAPSRPRPDRSPTAAGAGTALPGRPVPGPSGRAGRWVPVAASGAVILVLGVGYAILGRSGGEQRSGTVQVSVAAAGGTPSAGGLVVHDGDQVRASGTVLAVPGKPIRFCAPVATPAVARSGDPGVPDCTFGVPVVGVNLATLTGVQELAGVRFGDATLTGTWRTGTLHVTHQGPPGSRAGEPIRQTPCAAPAGGWQPGQASYAALRRYVEEEHPDRFRRPWVSYPDLATGSTPGAAHTEVLVVEVVHGDLAAEKRELQRRYSGNLCIVHEPGAPSLAEQKAAFDAARPALLQLMQDPANGLTTAGGGDTVVVGVLVLTPQVYDRITRAGLTSVDLNPWLRPVR